MVTADGYRGRMQQNPHDEPELKGYDLARKALEDARAAAKAAGKSVGQGKASPSADRGRPQLARRRGGLSGPGDDPARDPQSLGSLAGLIAQKRGWGPKVSEGTVLGQWEKVVGEELSAHATPIKLEDKTLYISARTVAWATQLRLMQRQILASIARNVGDGVVVKLTITGPKAPSWRKGERNVPGRGPRDTYG